MSNRWKKKNAPQVGQVWRQNAFRIHNRPIYLILHTARVGRGHWEITVLDLERGGRYTLDVKRDHETWERIV